MTDLVNDATEETLVYAPAAEFARTWSLRVTPAARVKLFATLARLNALSMIMRAGAGHIGSSFSSLDIVSWLHLERMGPGDLYFSSKGHDVPGLYAVLIGLGRLPFETVHGLRRAGGLPGHPEIATPGIAVNTGSLGMGISKAKGLVRAARAQGKSQRIYVLTGDGELQEGQIWESLASAVRDRMHEITVIVDHNKLQSDSFIDRVSPLGDLEAKVRAFGWAVARADGHDVSALDRALNALTRDAPETPRLLIADTIKGAGVSFMQPDAMSPDFYRFHSGAPSFADYRRAATELIGAANAAFAEAGAPPLTVVAVTKERDVPAAPTVQRLVPAYADALVAAAERRPDLMALDADLVVDTGLAPFRARFPERFLECGIAEQDMVSQASGLARGGLLPVVHSFAAFLTQRASEQIYNAASERGRIVYVGTFAGLLPADAGPSHQGLRDIAAMASIPGLTVVEPGSAVEVGPLLHWCVEEAPGPSYLRLVSASCDVPYAQPPGPPIPGRGTILRDGKDVAVIGYGPVLLSEAWKAADLLERRGLTLKLAALPWLNRIDRDWLREVLKGVRTLVTLDNHVPCGGQGAMIAAACVGMAPLRIESLAIEGWPLCGTAAEALAHHGLDAASLARTIARIHAGS